MAQSTSTIIIKATRETIWDCLTRPELVKKWQFDSTLTTNWNVGSDIKFENEWQGKIFEQRGKVMDFNPLETLTYSLFFVQPGVEDRPENYFKMRYQLTAAENGVRVDIIKIDDRDGAISEPLDEENPILIALRDLAESL